MSINSRNLTLSIFILLAILGALITPHYGESWDELKFFKYAASALSAYVSWPTHGTVPIFGNTYDNYGPAYVMLVTLAAKPLQIVFSESDARHYLYFVTFLAGLWAFYELAKRWLSRNAALFSTLLLATQPVLFGHAFISPKDIPFLSFFLLSFLFGLRLFDTLEPLPLNDLDPRPKQTLIVLSALWLAAAIGLFLFTDSIHAFIAGLVQSAKAGGTNIISLIASDLQKVEAEVYIQRYFVLFLRARSLLFLLSSLLLLFLIHRYSRPAFHSLLSIFFPAALLGITASIRILGPLAALFVTYYAIRKHGRKAFPHLVIYAIIAIIVMYLTWPYLWLNPVGHLVESLRVMSQYPWRGQVLFNGVEYQSTQLPYSYLPVLLGIQLTEPVWVLSALGLAAAVFGRRSEPVEGSKEKRGLLALSLVWFVIPLIGFIVTRAPLYDNFRQIFFILPPVFLLAGLAVEKIKNIKWQIALMILLLLPGVIDGLRLHPYEYIYYNRFIGGVGGAFRKYELDYWGTSYREAADWLNANAPEDAVIWADGPSHLLGMYLRKDLQMYSSYEAERADHYDYVVTTTRYNLDLVSYADAPIVHVIERGGALLTVIRQP